MGLSFTEMLGVLQEVLEYMENNVAYVTASGNLDAMMGVLGKDTEAAKVLRRLRSKVRTGSRNKTAESQK